MTSIGAATALVKFSTAGARDPKLALREWNERGIALPIDPLPGRAVHADVAVLNRPELRVVSGTLFGVMHGTAPGRRLEDDVFMALTVRGTTSVQGRGQEITLRDGDGIVLTNDGSGFAATHPRRVGFLGLRVSRTALAERAVRVEDAVMRRIPGRTRVLALLSTYLRSATDPRILDEAGLVPLLVTHVHDLVALAVDTTGRAAMGAPSRSLRAARLRSVQSDIAAHLGDPALSVGAVALRHAITPRYVHKLFEGVGLTFSDFVRGMRLARAHRMLADRRFASHRISAIAFEVGFRDLSNFNRLFRRRYGVTPSEVRQFQGDETVPMGKRATPRG